MGLSNAGKNAMLDELGSLAVFASLHDGAPGDTGANEISGGSPAYARKAIAWGSAASGAMDDSTNGAEFDVPSGTTVSYVGLWSASTAGTFYGFADVTDEVFASQGTYTVTDADISLT